MKSPENKSTLPSNLDKYTTQTDKQKIKTLIKEDKKTFRQGFSLNESVNEKGETNIIVKLADHIMAYQSYSNRYNLRINPALYEHLYTENKETKRPVHINVYNNVLMEDSVRRELFKTTLKNELTAKRMELRDNFKSCIIFGLFFLLISLTVAIGISFIPAETFLIGPGLYEVLSIIAWVFGWAATEKLLIEWISLRKEYRYLLKLTCAEISFHKMPEPLRSKPVEPDVSVKPANKNSKSRSAKSIKATETTKPVEAIQQYVLVKPDDV